MKLPKAVLGAVLIGITVQAATTSCIKKGDPTPKGEQGGVKPGLNGPDSCPGCGMG
ncbi:hypothetical protein [Hymenobacter sp. CRA2]|uniref:chryseobasin-related MNIO class RiPP peptide n=1 Tax=Hymenobacter sp. CRA2 TaxID=1955620 RepID=UPI0015925E43|nr:hypothetical protein [Hymenobacter sp. CRA2]